MSFNDPISELLTKIRNSKNAKHRYVDINVSRIKLCVIKILKDRGFIESFLVNDKKKKVRVFLKYAPDRSSIIHGLKRISKPGLRKYVKTDEIPKVLDGIGIAIVSTSKGIIDDESARKQKVGGELLCYVW